MNLRALPEIALERAALNGHAVFDIPLEKVLAMVF